MDKGNVLMYFRAIWLQGEKNLFFYDCFVN